MRGWAVLGVLGVLVAAAVQPGGGEVIVLNDEEYNQLPKLNQLDHYANCLVERGNAYCLASFNLTSPEPSELYEVMKMISEYENMNYNHTKLYRGVCVTKTCSRFLNSSSLETAVLAAATEACVNETVYKEFGFEAHLDELLYCKRTGERLPLDIYDWLFALVIGALLLLNVMGTIYDFHVRNPNEKGVPWLMAFSLRVSWNQLTVIRTDADGDPRLVNLKSIQGLRTLTMFLVVLSHVMLLNMYRVPPDNPRLVELANQSFLIAFMYNGNLVMQTFMLMASFLMAYNFLIFRETHSKFSWRYLPNAIIQRFLRLTPVYMIVVSFVATWGPRLQTGALCPIMEDERQACRNKWWAHMFYLHNVVQANDHCLPQSWYLGADMQLFLLGVTIIIFLWRYPGLTRPLLGVGLLLATVQQFVTIYYFGLRPLVLMQSPEKIRTLYRHEPSFQHVHTSFHGNMQGYIMGIIVGLAYYKWEKEGSLILESKWFKMFHVLSFPVGFCWVMAGYFLVMIENQEEYRLTLALYATVDRLVFSIFVAGVCLGTFSNSNNSLYSRILGWRGFQAMGRLTYGVMLLHTITYFNMTCSMNYPRELGFYSMTNDLFANLAMTYIAAIPLTLFIEYPLQRLMKVLQGAPGAKRVAATEDKAGTQQANAQQTNGKKAN